MLICFSLLSYCVLGFGAYDKKPSWGNNDIGYISGKARFIEKISGYLSASLVPNAFEFHPQARICLDFKKF